MWSVSDDALLAGLAAGDPDAAAAFVERFQRRVYGLALAIIGEPRAAEEVAREAFVRVWRHASTYDPRRGTVPTWVLSTCRSVAIEHLALGPGRPLDPAGTLPADDTGGGPEEAATMGDDIVRLRDALDHLPPDERRALSLAEFQGLTAAEVGARVGVPVFTAQSRIRAAMLRLHSALAREGGRGEGGRA